MTFCHLAHDGQLLLMFDNAAPKLPFKQHLYLFRTQGLIKFIAQQMTVLLRNAAIANYNPAINFSTKTWTILRSARYEQRTPV